MKESQVHISTKTLVRFWLVIIVLALIIVALWMAQSAVVIVLISFFMALVLNRPVSFFAKHIPGKSRALGVFISYIITIGIIVGVLVLVLPLFFEQSLNFVKTLPDTIAHLDENSAWIASFVAQYGLESQYQDFLASINNSISGIAAGLGAAMVDIVANLVNVITAAIFVLFITFFMLTEGPTWVDKYWKFAYTDESRRKRHEIVAGKMYDVISGFVSGQIVVAAVSGIFAGIGALAVSVIFAFPASIVLPIVAIVFVSSFIPMFGAVIGGAVSTLLILIHDPFAALIYLAYFTLYQQFLGNWLSPKIQGKRMNMSPLIVLIALTIGFQVAGILGALISIPLAGCVIVIVREYFSHRRNKKEKDPTEDVLEIEMPDESKTTKKKINAKK